MSVVSPTTHSPRVFPQRHLLRALFSADAVVTNNTLELKSDSLPLLQDVQLLLLGFGVQSAIFDGGAVAYGGLPDRRMSPTTSGPRSPRGDADYRRHGLRIDPGSLRLLLNSSDSFPEGSPIS